MNYKIDQDGDMDTIIRLNAPLNKEKIAALPCHKVNGPTKTDDDLDATAKNQLILMYEKNASNRVGLFDGREVEYPEGISAEQIMRLPKGFFG